jgi:DNA-binding NtrC family response regulator
MNLSEKEKNNKILAIDDETDVLDFLNLFLSTLGWEIITAPSIEKAFDALDKNHFFLIITDIAMPDMDGYEFINKIKEMNVPSQVALMTGFGYNPKHTLVMRATWEGTFISLILLINS